jgi:hypothetical protein
MDSAHLARTLTSLVGPGAWDVRYGYRAGAPVVDIQLARVWSFEVGTPPEEIARAIAADLKPAQAPLSPLRAWPHATAGVRWNTTRTGVTFNGERLEGCVWPAFEDGRVSVRDCELTPAQVERLGHGTGLLTFVQGGVELTCPAAVQHASSEPDPATGERGFVEFRFL